MWEIFYLIYQFQDKNKLIKSSEVSNEFKTLSNNFKKNKSENRVYFSPEFYKDLNSLKLTHYGLSSNVDLIKLNLAPFNGSFKGVYLGQFNDQFTKTRSYINSSFNYINSENFLSSFNIRYLLIYENELDEINNLSNFRIIDTIEIDLKNNLINKKLKLLERINYDNKIQIIEEKKNLLKCEGKIIDCIIRNDDFLKFNDRITFEFDNKNSTYAFNNNSNEDIYLIAPFLYDKNWKSNNPENISDVNQKLTILKIKSNDKTIIYYKDEIRIILKIISLTLSCQH